MNFQKMNKSGFTLLELVIVVAIVAILAAIAYPNYSQYSKRVKRGDMMTEMQSIGTQIEAQKIALGSYKKINKAGFEGAYPKGKAANYNLTLNLGTTGDWTLTANPIPKSMQEGDGVLTLDYSGKKCRGTKCGMGDEWKD